MADIFEKAGITPIVEFMDDRGLYVCNSKPVRELEKQRNEMLEALVDLVSFVEDMMGILTWDENLEDPRKIIEKATGLTWEEINE